MRTYYLFKISKISNLKKIYLILEELYYLNSNKFKYGITIFNNMCKPLNKSYLISELKKRYLFIDNKFFSNSIDSLSGEITNICIVVKTNENFPEIFKYINRLEKNIFVVDFINEDYFFLDDFIKLNFKLAI